MREITGFVLVVFTLSFYTVADVVYNNNEIVEIARVLEEGSSEVVVEFNLQELEVIDEHIREFGKGCRFHIQNDKIIKAKVGTPDVPVIQINLQIPNTGNVKAGLLTNQTESLGYYKIAPVQRPPTICGITYPYEINETVYTSNQYYPASQAKIVSYEILRDIRIARINFYPVRYNPVTNEVLITTKASVKFFFNGGSSDNKLKIADKGITRSFIPQYKDVLNFDKSLLETLKQDEVGCYAFMGSRATLEAVEELINWKIRKGYDVKSIDVDTVGSTSDAIDSWIEDAYNSWPNKPEYIFLVGGEKVIPPPKSGNYEADFKFGCIGSSNDASIHVGRITDKDDGTDNLTYQAWKIRMHEMEPFEPGENWFNNGYVWGCTDLNSEAKARDWAKILSDNGMKAVVGTESDGPTGSQYEEVFNNGISIFGTLVHGNASQWISANFKISNIANLKNDRRGVWLNNHSCNTANFSNRYCFSEAWICEGTIDDPKGAIGLLGCSESAMTNGESIHTEMWKAYFTNKELWHMGAAVTYGKSKNNNQSNKDCFIFFGCPELDVYTIDRELPVLKCDHQPPQPGKFEIKVSTDVAGPIDGALVGVVTTNYIPLASGFTDASGELTLTLPAFPQNTDSVFVTATYHNCAPYLGVFNYSTGITGNFANSTFKFTLGAAVPNPVRSSAVIKYSLPIAGAVQFDVYKASGCRVYSVKSDNVEAGHHTIEWNGKDYKGNLVPNAVYIYKLTTNQGSRVRSCFVMR